MSNLSLAPDDLLATTCTVRKRLDFDRPVSDDLIRECVALAMQSPSGSNVMTMRFVVVRDAGARAAIGGIYRQCYAISALVIACTTGGRLDSSPAVVSAARMGNVLPAMWSFMLAARARGIGTCWTTLHLMMEQQVADVLGIPFDAVQQVCLSRVAFTRGTDFKPAARPPADSIIHGDQW